MNALWTFFTGVVQNIVSLVQGFASRLSASPTGPPQPSIHFEPPTKILRTNFSTDVVRSDDLLVLHFEFYNIALDQDPSIDAGAKLVRETAAEAYIAAVLQPQSFGERAYLEAQEQVGAPPVPSRIAGPSWIVFRIPHELLATPYTLPDIL